MASVLHGSARTTPRLRAEFQASQESTKRFKTYEIGYVHIDSCELRHADGKLVMFLAIDRVSKFTYVEFHHCAGKMEGAAFLENVVEIFPYQIHIVLTDNGMAFADLPKNRNGPSRRFLGPHIFDRVCIANGIEHRLTKALLNLSKGPIIPGPMAKSRAHEPHHQGCHRQNLPL